MNFRTVLITKHCKLDYKMGYLVIRSNEDTRRVFLDEIAILIIENIAVSITCYLLKELISKKIKVIFCDEKRNPLSELISYYGSHDTSLKVQEQFSWKQQTKNNVWQKIVENKIIQQANVLKKYNFYEEFISLFVFSKEVKAGDSTNREGHAAKVYFNNIFGKEFTRNASSDFNPCLNFGYGILLSAFNREIVSSGYITQVGIFHKNQFNQFNFSSDLMEPFRPLIDDVVKYHDLQVLCKNAKYLILDSLNERVTIDGTKQTVLNAIKIYTRSVFDALNSNDSSKIKFYTNEL
ncbi:MAG TPA: type II CRISPR-associated endonuclease Cas1 [Gallicola sp.]|nr:type II CRISPR-associated endonuclease Cas1 [Gallicola sp.]